MPSAIDRLNTGRFNLFNFGTSTQIPTAAIRVKRSESVRRGEFFCATKVKPHH